MNQGLATSTLTLDPHMRKPTVEDAQNALERLKNLHKEHKIFREGALALARHEENQPWEMLPHAKILVQIVQDVTGGSGLVGPMGFVAFIHEGDRHLGRKVELTPEEQE